MSSHRVRVALLLAGLVATPAGVHAAAVLIPDHTFRLGACGGPEGAPCTWQCGTGPGCTGGGTCTLEGTRAFGAALVAKGDATPCGAQAGVVLRLGLAGLSNATPVQITDTVLDLCNRDITCTGREPRSCAVCNDTDPDDLLCSSDDGAGNFPCPPDDVVFLCKDPCSGGTPDFGFFSEDDVANLLFWFRETRQPLPEFMRVALQASFPSPPPPGRPVIYHVDEQLPVAGDPPVTRFCVRVLFTTQDRPTGICSSDPRRFCVTADDCPKGDTCLAGTPDMVNDPNASAVVSGATCAGGTRAGRPCADGGDCVGGTCAALPASATAEFCSGSLAPCTGGCPSAQTCVSCPGPACGDGVLDPGEQCDDGGTTSGDGCDATCHIEPCTECTGVLGEQSFCFQASDGTPCDIDGTPCTADLCNAFGDCVAGGAPTGCAVAEPEKAALQFKRDPDDPDKSKLTWKWTSAAAFETSSLGDPAHTDALSLCLFDASGLRFDATAPAGQLCGKKPCWAVAAHKIKYKDKDGTPDGLTKLKGKSGDAGKGKVQVLGKGANLVLPSSALTVPVQAYLVRGNGSACLQATYSTADPNEPGRFKAKSD